MRLHSKIVAATILTAAATVGPVSTAQAASYITVCNNSYSVDAIRVFNTSVGYTKTLWPGNCSSSVRDDGGNARVDVDPAGGWADVDSWVKRWNPDPYGTCYESENHASDPYSGSPATRATTYLTYDVNGCSLG